MIQQLMCRGRIDIAAIERRHDIDFTSYFSAALQRLGLLAADGLVTLDALQIAATSRGRLLLRIIAACFDRYLTESAARAGAARYSSAL